MGKKLGIAISRVGAGLLSLFCALLTVALGDEVVHVLGTSPAQVHEEYHFGAEHYGGDWAYASLEANVLHGAFWSLLLAFAATSLGYYVVRPNRRAALGGLVVVGVFVAETAVRAHLGC